MKKQLATVIASGLLFFPAFAQDSPSTTESTTPSQTRPVEVETRTTTQTAAPVTTTQSETQQSVTTQQSTPAIDTQSNAMPWAIGIGGAVLACLALALLSVSNSGGAVAPSRA